jgi:hypothetical protein
MDPPRQSNRPSAPTAPHASSSPHQRLICARCCPIRNWRVARSGARTDNPGIDGVPHRLNKRTPGAGFEASRRLDRPITELETCLEAGDLVRESPISRPLEADVDVWSVFVQSCWDSVTFEAQRPGFESPGHYAAATCGRCQRPSASVSVPRLTASPDWLGDTDLTEPLQKIEMPRYHHQPSGHAQAYERDA